MMAELSERERMLRMINGQRRLISKMRTLLRWYSGVGAGDDREDMYPHESCEIQRKAIRSNKRALKLLRDHGRNV